MIRFRLFRRPVTNVTVTHIHNPAPVDPVQQVIDANRYVKAYMDLDRPRGAQVVSIPVEAIPLLPGLRLLHPDQTVGWLIDEAKRIYKDASDGSVA